MSEAKTPIEIRQPRRAFGGDFELHQVQRGSVDRLGALTGGLVGTWTASGRSALALLLQDLRRTGMRHVHLPAFVCESVLQPVRELGLEYSFYPVDSSLTARPDPPRGAAVLLIHYFGWHNPATEQLRAEAGRSFQLIEDATHSFLSGLGDLDSKRCPGWSMFFSARKFGPVPLGGWCSISAPKDAPTEEMEAVFRRSLEARLLRGAYLDSPGAPVDAATEADYLSASRGVEAFLDRHSTNHAVPPVALQMAAGIDWVDVAGRRRSNWLRLHGLTAAHVDSLMPDLSAGVVPLGYVVQLRERDRVRQLLASLRVFCPVHWRLPPEVDSDRFPEAALLSRTLLTVPIDQRYGQVDMAAVSEALMESVRRVAD